MSLRFSLIGHPVGHSVSPQIQAAAYASLGIDAVYGLLDCPTEQDVRAAVERVSSGELRGVNVTVPHKQLALELATRAEASASRIGAANVLAYEGGEVVAYNTDAWALARELESKRDAAGIASGGSALILGAGGAALAAVESARLAGYETIFVSARRFVGEHHEAWPGYAELARTSAKLLPWASCFRDINAHELRAVIQATSAGMKGKTGGEELASHVPWSALPRLLAYDLIYNPPLTPFLAQAQASGHATSHGLGMLVLQAARSIEIWTGRLPETAPMMKAARSAIGLDVGADGAS